jgi:RNA polymerase sigma factor (sigma-70 family)
MDRRSNQPIPREFAQGAEPVEAIQNGDRRNGRNGNYGPEPEEKLAQDPEPATRKQSTIRQGEKPPLRTEAEAWELVNGVLPCIEKLVEEALWHRGLKPELKAAKAKSHSSADSSELFDDSNVPSKGTDKEEWKWYQRERKEQAKLIENIDTYTDTRDELLQDATMLAFSLALNKYDPARSKFETYISTSIKQSLKLKDSEHRPDALDRVGKSDFSKDGDIEYWERHQLEHQFAGKKKKTNRGALMKEAVQEDALLAGEWFHMPEDPEPKFVRVDRQPARDPRISNTLEEAIDKVPQGYMRAILRDRILKGKSYKKIAKHTGRREADLKRDVGPVEQALRDYYL